MNAPFMPIHKTNADGPATLSGQLIIGRGQPSEPKRANTLLQAFSKNILAVVGATALAALIVCALAAPYLFPEDPLSTVAAAVIPPFHDAAYPLGTDPLGRDVLAQLFHGARISLAIGFLSAFFSIVIGMIVGGVSGYFGGWIDDVLVRLTELFQATPSFLLAVVIVTLGGPSLGMITFAIGLGSFPTIARLVRAEIRALRSADFVIAAQSQGYSSLRILTGEIAPNTLPPIIITTSVLIAAAILTEAGLSFLGLGDPNVPTWGSMIGTGRTMLQDAWYLTAIPGLLIVFTILNVNLVGDGLSDALNPKLRRPK